MSSPTTSPASRPDGPSFTLQGLTQEQYAQLGDYVVFDAASGKLQAITRDDVGERMQAAKHRPDARLSRPRSQLADGKQRRGH